MSPGDGLSVRGVVVGCGHLNLGAVDHPPDVSIPCTEDHNEISLMPRHFACNLDSRGEKKNPPSNIICSLLPRAFGGFRMLTRSLRVTCCVLLDPKPARVSPYHEHDPFRPGFNPPFGRVMGIVLLDDCVLIGKYLRAKTICVG